MSSPDQSNPGTLTITNHMLGLDPYVLIRFEVEEQDVVAKIEVGVVATTSVPRCCSPSPASTRSPPMRWRC
jgi:hypothetical protein